MKRKGQRSNLKAFLSSPSKGEDPPHEIAFQGVKVRVIIEYVVRGFSLVQQPDSSGEVYPRLRGVNISLAVLPQQASRPKLAEASL